MSGPRFILWLFGLAVALLVLGSLVGCADIRPLQGGKARIAPSPGGSAVEIDQPENPAAPSVQAHEVLSETSLEIPAGSVVVQNASTNSQTSVQLAAPSVLKTTRSEKTHQEIGAAQKDLSREIGAKLASLRPVQFFGLLFIVASVAMFHPAIKTLVGSRTVQLVTGMTGVAMVALPVVLVGNERLILFAALVPAVWWIIHRNASKSTEVRVLREFIDENHDGIDDRKQKSTP